MTVTPPSNPSAGPVLTAEELRVLACLIEKGHTTPDQYPMSTNALVAACNQKTSREPVVDYGTNLVDHTLQLLRDGGWARSKRSAGERAFKHRHVIDDRLGLDGPEQALLAVLALRGPQSPGELKTRTERYHPFADPADVERVLQRMAMGEPALVRNVGRGPGQSQDRWIQLLGPTPDASPAEAEPVMTPVMTPAVPSSGPMAPEPAAAFGPRISTGAAGISTGSGPGGSEELDRLRNRVAELEDRIDRLERELGL